MSDTNDMRREFLAWVAETDVATAWASWQAATERATATTDAKIAALRQKVSENELMAECTVMLRDDLIEAGIVDKTVPPMMLTEAILGYISAIRQGGAT